MVRAPVERSVVDGLGDVGCVDPIAGGQIRDRSGYPQDPGVGASREPETIDASGEAVSYTHLTLPTILRV